MKFLLLLLIAFCVTNASAQSYQSIFGTNSTQWNIAWLATDNIITDSVFVEKDTVVNGLTWKKIKKHSTMYPHFRGGLLREDTQVGKVWYKSLGTVDTSIVLAFDFSLNKSDTFNIRNPHGDYTTALRVVDTTYISNGRKNIVFKASISSEMQLSEKVTFIEGVGSNLGVFYKDFQSAPFAPYLLCSFKDGKQTYSNTTMHGQCQVTKTGIRNVIQTNDVAVYPTLFTDKIIIENKSNYRFVNLSLITTDGKIIFVSRFTDRLNLPQLPPGLYYLCLYTEKGELLQKTLVKQ